MITFKSGALKSRLDVRDLRLGSVQKPVEFPETYLTDLSKYPNHFQNNKPACAAFAGAILKIIQEWEQECSDNPNLSRRYLWKKIKDINGYPPELGTEMRTIFKALRKFGISDFGMIDETTGHTVSIQDYAKPTITAGMDDNAQPRIISSYAFLNDLSFEGIKRAIYQNKAVILLIYCDDGFFGRKDITYTEHKYAHYVVAGGYDKDHIIIIDSTEPNFPIKRIHQNYAHCVKEGGTALDLDNDVVKKMVKKKELLQKLVKLWQIFVDLTKKVANK